MSDADASSSVQVPDDDDDDGHPRPVWIPDVVSLGGLGSGWDGMPAPRSWIGW